MRYTTILFDVDGTLVDSDHAVRESFRTALIELGMPEPDEEAREIAMTRSTAEALKHVGYAGDMVRGGETVIRHLLALQQKLSPFPGVMETLEALKQRGCRMAIVTSRTLEEVRVDPSIACCLPYFDFWVCTDHTEKHKPHPDPLLYAAKKMDVRPEDALYIGDSPGDAAAAKAANMPFALALWGARPGQTIRADHYLARPDDVVTLADNPDHRWLSWASELQFLAQAGLTYSTNPFDLERFQRIREISAEIMSAGTGLAIDRITDLFCSETGFQTPKLDTRAALFDGDRILLVQELDGRWSLPGGWVDVNQTVGDNAVKEVLEEAGLNAEIVKLIAVQDRNRHNRPRFAYGITKVFVLCRALGGAFRENTETTATGYFALDELPPLSESKTTAEQVRMCFAARAENWQPPVD